MAKYLQLVNVIRSRHSTPALARRHLLKLQREYPEPKFQIQMYGPLRADGKPSERGTYYVFEIYKVSYKKRKPEKKKRKHKTKRKVKRKKLPKPKKKEKLPEPEDFEDDPDAEYGGAFDSP